MMNLTTLIARVLLLAMFIGTCSTTSQEADGDVDTLTPCPSDSRLILEGSALNTNYTEGTGFTPGIGSHPHTEVSNTVTDARSKRFANQRTDRFTFRCGDRPLVHLADLATQSLGEDMTVRLLRPDDDVLDQLETDTRTLQFIVNQPLNANGHDLLVTWAIPPDWSPDRSYTTMLFTPGLNHTNNSKLFGNDSFMETYLHALRTSASGDIILMHANAGGRLSITVQRGIEAAYAEALRWGRDHLGVDLDRIVMGGGSRGGYGSMIQSGRLAQMEDVRIRGVFASVFGSFWAESDAPYELVPGSLVGLFNPRNFEDIKEQIFERDDVVVNETQLRLAGEIGPEARAELGSLPSAQLLMQAAETDGPVTVYLGYGSGDYTMLPSSALRHFALFEKGSAVHARVEIELGVGHEARDKARNEAMAAFAAALADGGEPQPWTGDALVFYEATLSCSPTRPVAHLRYPFRTATRDYDGERRRSAFDVTGPAGATFTVRLLDDEGTAVETVTGTLSDAYSATPYFTVPDTPGTYTVSFELEGVQIGTGRMEVVAGLPSSPQGLEAYDVRPQPTIFESLLSVPGC